MEALYKNIGVKAFLFKFCLDFFSKILLGLFSLTIKQFSPQLYFLYILVPWLERGESCKKKAKEKKRSVDPISLVKMVNLGVKVFLLMI
jgi:hypothetical protein